jgi:hypothetical protein
VHGTNAGNPNDEGEHWWQKNKPNYLALNIRQSDTPAPETIA